MKKRIALARDHLIGVVIRKLVRLRFRLNPPDFHFFAQLNDPVGLGIQSRGYYERSHLEYIQREFFSQDSDQNGVMLDIGANIGNHTLYFSNLFRRVESFEANPVVRRILAANVLLNGLEAKVGVHECGLSNRETDVRLFFDSARLGSGSCEETNRSQSANVEMKVGDSFEFSDVGFIKIDVEGHEWAVLKGLEETIRREKPLIAFEYNRGDEKICELLSEIGYTSFLGLKETGKFTTVVNSLTKGEDLIVRKVTPPIKEDFDLVIASN